MKHSDQKKWEITPRNSTKVPMYASNPSFVNVLRLLDWREAEGYIWKGSRWRLLWLRRVRQIEMVCQSVVWGGERVAFPKMSGRREVKSPHAEISTLTWCLNLSARERKLLLSRPAGWEDRMRCICYGMEWVTKNMNRRPIRAFSAAESRNKATANTHSSITVSKHWQVTSFFTCSTFKTVQEIIKAFSMCFKSS